MPRDMEKNRKWHRQWYKKEKQSHPEKYLLYGARRRAKDAGLSFNLELDDIVIPEMCPIMKVPLQVTQGKSRSNSPSLDRVDSTKGYVKGNVRVISMKANAAKSDLTADQIKRLYEYVFGLEKS